MKAYVIAFLVATVLNLLCEKMYFKKHSKKKFIPFILMGMSIFTLCFVAAVRDLSVGTDIYVYVTRLYNVSLNYSNVFSYLKNCNSDLLFALTVYIGALTKNINIVLFLIQFCAVIPIYIYSYKLRYNKSFTLNILIFLLTMYCVSLNLMRQSIAISFCLLSYYYFDSGNKKKSYILLLVAVLFHKTALIFLLAFLINKIVKSNNKDKKLLIFLLIMGMVVATFSMKYIVSISSYSEYLFLDSREFSLGSIIKRIFWIMLVLIGYRFNREKQNSENYTISLIFLLISLFTTLTSFAIPGTGRLGFYFTDIAYFLFIFDIPKYFKQKNMIYLFVFITLFGLWWISTAVPNDSSRVYPYKSDIIDVLN